MVEKEAQFCEEVIIFSSNELERRQLIHEFQPETLLHKKLKIHTQLQFDIIA